LVAVPELASPKGGYTTDPRGPHPGAFKISSSISRARDPVATGSSKTWRPNPSLLCLSRCPLGVLPAGRGHPSRGLRRSPAKEHRDTCRTKTQDGSLLASENLERPSGRPHICSCPRDTFPGLPCGPVVSTDAPDDHQTRRAVGVESPLNYHPSSLGSMGSGSRGAFHEV
jgi:hypothetical protein